jgi:hypothetical protein
MPKVLPADYGDLVLELKFVRAQKLNVVTIGDYHPNCNCEDCANRSKKQKSSSLVVGVASPLGESNLIFTRTSQVVRRINIWLKGNFHEKDRPNFIGMYGFLVPMPVAANGLEEILSNPS